MKNFIKGLESKVFTESVGMSNEVHSFIQPFKEMPSLKYIGNENADQINAHDLFSIYTADIIKEDIVFTR